MTAPTRPAIGDVIMIADVNDQLPIGTVVHFLSATVDGSSRTYTKHNPDGWVSSSGHYANASTFTRRVIVDSYPDQFTVRQIMSSVELFDQAPNGTVVDLGDDSMVWQKEEGGLWRHLSDDWRPVRSARRMFDGAPDYRIRSLPQDAPQGTDLTVSPVTYEAMDAAAAGTVIAHARTSNQYEKRADGRWWRGDGNWTRDAFNPETYVFFSFPETPVIVGTGITAVPLSDVEAQVEVMKTRIIECIDACVSSQGWGNVRDAAWWRLGLRADLPVGGAQINNKKAYGLPEGSLVQQDGTLFRIDYSESRPVRLDIPGNPDSEFALTEVNNARVVHLGTPAEVTYYSASDLLNKFWVIYRELQPLYQWCSYVSNALEAAGLNDPGPQVQQYVAEVPVVLQVPVVGEVFFTTNRQERDGFLNRLDLLPVGSVLQSRERGLTYHRLASSWMNQAGEAALPRGGDRLNLIVAYIPAVVEDESF